MTNGVIWLKTFYPVDAKHVPKKDAIDHCIRKWTGLLPDVLRAYALSKNIIDDVIDDANGELVLEMGTKTCALCEHYFDGEDEEECGSCPLAKVRDGVPCDRTRRGEDEAPWHAWSDRGDAEPMLDWLLLAKKQA